MTEKGAHRFAMLDGWRACSILLVLAGHLFPLGPARFRMNEAVAASGMVLFFILSGFLITRFLSENADLRVFVIRRFFRIVPVAWLAMLIVLGMAGADGHAYLTNLLFVANLPTISLVHGGSHLWSLCVEMQFYVGIALLVAVTGRRGLYLVPLICLGVTVYRASVGAEIDIVTWRRVDEILAGGILALAYGGWFGAWPAWLLGRVNVYLMLPVLLASAHPAFGPLNYARPYIAMLTVGASLYNSPPLLRRLFETRAMAYIATVSYAVYIIHGVLRITWLDEGSKLIRYAKRPLLLAATFALAHLSTFYYERPCIALAKRLTGVRRGQGTAGAA